MIKKLLVISFLFLQCFKGDSAKAVNIQSLEQTLYSDVASLLAQRNNLINAHQSTIAVDRELAALGHIPTAVLHKTVQPQFIVMTMEIYKQIPSDKVQRIEDRLKSSFTDLQDINIEETSGAVEMKLNPSVSAETLNSLLLILGYKGYEVR
jgi:hypothetical protein